MNRKKKADSKIPCWPYGDIKKCVKKLVEAEQPFCLAKYATWMNFLPESKDYTYELIIYQNAIDRREMDAMKMDKQTFYELIAQYDMQEVHKDASAGRCYAMDNRLHDLVWKERDLRFTPEKHIKAIESVWHLTSIPVPVRDALKTALDEYKRALDEIVAQHREQNHIITYQF